MPATSYIGIDISKLTLDFCIYDKISKHFIKIENTSEAITQIFSTDTVLKTLRKSTAFFCMEDTGLYKNPLVNFLQEKKYKFAVPSALHIKLSMGLTRGKTDKLDAERIAIFAAKNEKELQQWVPRRAIVNQLQQLLRLQRKLKKIYKGLTMRVREGQHFQDKSLQRLAIIHCQNTMCAVEQDINQLETNIYAIIQSDDTLKRLYAIILSVKGAGPVLANTLIAVTNEFKKFPGPNPFSCYAALHHLNVLQAHHSTKNHGYRKSETKK